MYDRISFCIERQTRRGARCLQGNLQLTKPVNQRSSQLLSIPRSFFIENERTYSRSPIPSFTSINSFDLVLCRPLCSGHCWSRPILGNAQFLSKKYICGNMLLPATGIQTRMPSMIVVESNCPLYVLRHWAFPSFMRFHFQTPISKA